MTIPISLLVIHFIADFVFQNDWMALNKSKDNRALTAHVGVYTWIVFVLAFWIPIVAAVKFAVVTFVLHWITDYFTSRATSRLWFMKMDYAVEVPPMNDEHSKVYDNIVVTPWKRHWFFVMIGFDQLIHYVTLALTYRWFYGA